ncbi:MAG: hypothetical protein L0I76_08445 [Pseudonocardia sp.]|nr:hypothetical protein [Pseudonocardia sp.]
MSARSSRAAAAAAIVLIVLGSGAGLAGSAQAGAPQRPGSAPLVTVEGGQFRTLYSDGQIGDWVDAGDQFAMTVKPGDVVEVRGWGATCRTDYLGQITAHDRAWPFLHAYCPAPTATGPEPAPAGVAP